MNHGRSRLVVLAELLACGLAGCDGGTDRGEIASVTPAASADAPPETIPAKDLCQLLYRDLDKELESCASKDADAAPSRAALREANDKCMTLLEASVVSGRLEIPKASAETCAKTVRAAFREGAPLRAPIDLAGFEGCRELFVGKLPEGGACRTALECKAPLICKAPDGVDKPIEGTCAAPATVGQTCWPNNDAILLSGRASCGTDSYCPGAPKSDLSFSFGLGLSGIGDGSSRGEGIGLGKFGNPSGTGQGFGSSSPLAAGSHRPKPPSVRMGATEMVPAGRLPPEVIQRIVRQNFGRFRLCYENGLRSDPELAGTVTVKFVINRDGSVGAVDGAGSKMRDSGVVSCVTKAFHGLSFPQPEGGTVKVTYPIQFAPGDLLPPLVAASATPKPDPVASAAPKPESAGIAPILGAPSAAPPDAGPQPSTGGRWSGAAPTAGLCRARAPRGHGCLLSDGCAAGLACVGEQCVEPSAGQRLSCQADRDCSLWQKCNGVGIGGGDYTFGVCVDRKPAKAACSLSDECRGACVAGSCAPTCPEKSEAP